ncbi:unnamed protein product [Rotaria socialis]|uniref:Uncharacterized protein n=2 Tax=Rotaria socialis TaxID=392032 RepID=A0A820AGU1_9BILA|nr:unnamed protein product [Rotaria socialis]CAF3413144.1 unnamed protein product [Rotaria socialis]CAF3426036.1 unnamed protein product [Rotaria socialis]CAF3455309.1 unnamed protein product [Rotaria socialis]CAF3679427.1 unnamed protein product [Rotaria socialis]
MASSDEISSSPIRRNILGPTTRQNIDPHPPSQVVDLQIDLVMANAEWREKCDGLKNKLQEKQEETKKKLQENEEEIKKQEEEELKMQQEEFKKKGVAFPSRTIRPFTVTLRLFYGRKFAVISSTVIRTVWS